jgi:GT2 family glycosyltransferase
MPAASVCIRRNQAAELASSSILIGIDDDSEFTSPRVVAQTIEAFDHPRVGAVAAPLIDLPREEAVRQIAPVVEGVYVPQQFKGAACALRRSAFLLTGGYRVSLEHQSEEPDLCIRLLSAGYVVRLGHGEPVRHDGSPRRNLKRTWFRTCRNDVVFGWNNVPMPDLLGYWGKTVPYVLWLGHGVNELTLFALSVSADFMRIRRDADRRSVAGRVYRPYRKLGKRGPLELGKIEHGLPPLRNA